MSHEENISLASAEKLFKTKQGENEEARPQSTGAPAKAKTHH
jgi:hypothetical protein